MSGEETALHCLLTKLDECYGFLVGGVLSPIGLTAEEAAVSDITSLWNDEIVDIICTVYGGMSYCFLTHFYPVGSSIIINWASRCSILGVSDLFSFYQFYRKSYANSENPDQTPRSAASDRGLDCLSMSLLKGRGTFLKNTRYYW